MRLGLQWAQCAPHGLWHVGHFDEVRRAALARYCQTRKCQPQLLGLGVELALFSFFWGWGSLIIPSEPKRVPFLFLGYSRV